MNFPIVDSTIISVGGVILPCVISIYLKFSVDQPFIQAVVEQAIINTETKTRVGETTELYYVKDILRTDTPSGPIFCVELIKPSDLVQ